MNTLMLAAAAAVTNAVTGATLPSAAELGTVVVEASRLGQTKLEIPSHVEVITKSEIDASGAASTVDLLEKRGNLFLRKLNGNPALAQISMRGYGANSFGRVKVIVDGEDINSPDMAAQDLLRIPVRSIERVEILHGPQTVLHGGDASAGVINIVTGGNDYTKKTTLEVHGGNLGQIGVYAGTRGGFEDLGLTYFGNFSYDHSDGWRANSYTEAYSVKGGLRQNFENGSSFGFRAFYANTRYGLPGSLFSDGYDWYGNYHGPWKDNPRDTDTPDDRAHNDVYGFMVDGEAVLNDENRLSSSFSFRNRKAKSYYVSYMSETDADLYGFVWNLVYSNTADLFGFGNRLDVGTDHKVDLLHIESGAKNSYSRYSAALFARDEFFILDGLSVFGGARGEAFCSRDVYRTVAFRSAAEKTKSDVAGEVGVNWRPLDDLKMFAKWSRFYHAPLADELYSYYGPPNMSLRPESGYNTEVGLDWSFLDGFNFNITGFYAELDDEIMYAYGGNRNVDDATARSGVETGVTWHRDRVGSAGVLYRYVDARFTEGPNKNNAMPIVPAHMTRAYGEVFLIEWLAVNGGYRYVSRQALDSDFSAATDKMPGYGVFDVGLRAMPTCSPLKGFTFAFTIDNLFDKRYANYGVYNGVWAADSFYPACGRSFLFTVRYEF